NPLSSWPHEILFYVRVASLLHGLCNQLNVKVPFLQILYKRAYQCLSNRYIHLSLQFPLQFSLPELQHKEESTSKLNFRIQRFLTSLYYQKRILGCQVAVIKNGKFIVNTFAGQMGPVDRRPVASESLFCGYAVNNGILTTALLKLIDEKKVHLDDFVCNWWDGFIRYGKQKITLRHILTHQAGLHKALPENLTLSNIVDYKQMIRIIED
ncbi:ABC1 family protein, partial [Cardiosporidium cionae]